jgi:CRISPR-associated protein Cas1
MHLVINKFGSTVYVKDRKFEIHNKDGKVFFAPSKVDSIFMMRGTKLTTDAISLAVHNNIDLVILEKSGEPIGRVWSNRYGSVSTIRKQQVFFSESIEALRWIRDITSYKIQSQNKLLQTLVHDRPAKKDIIEDGVTFLERMDTSIQQLDIHDAGFKDTLRGYEGNASKAYFKILSAIVPEAYTFDKRSRRPAKDMFNAMLNYMYGILYARIEGSLIKAGLDPYLGIFHRDEYNKPVLAFDVIEKYRVWADTVALRLCVKRIPEKYMFDTVNNGVWLGTSGKKMVIEAFNDFMDEIIQHNHRRRNRLNHIDADMHEFAKYLEKNDFRNSTHDSQDKKEIPF